jgi:hypothetical protein
VLSTEGLPVGSDVRQHILFEELVQSSRERTGLACVFEFDGCNADKKFQEFKAAQRVANR